MLKGLSIFFRVLSWMVYLVLAAALLIAAPLAFGYRPVVVLSGSMEPAYPVGSVIYYKAVAFNDIQVGDAITFSIGDGSLATHRVTAKDESNQTFTTKGDNNPSEDPSPVAYSEVVGKSSPIAIPYAGYFTSYAQNWYAIAGMGLILLINMLLSPDSDKKKKGKPQSELGIGQPWEETPPTVASSPQALPAAESKTKRKARSAQEYFQDL